MSVAKPVIVFREEWGAAPPKNTPIPVATPTPELWLHHSASPGSDEATVKAIQTFHQALPPTGRGWNDIAYSFLIDNDVPDIDIFEGRGGGIRPAATAGHNLVSHAICLIGNYDVASPSGEALDRIAHLVAYGYDHGWWMLGFTGGHRDVGATKCPGDNLYPLIGAINIAAIDIYNAAREEPMGMYVLSRGGALPPDGGGTRASDVAYHVNLINRSYGTSFPINGSWGDDVVALIKAELGGNGTYITGNMAALLLTVHNSGGLPSDDWLEWRSQVDQEIAALEAFEEDVRSL